MTTPHNHALKIPILTTSKNPILTGSKNRILTGMKFQILIGVKIDLSRSVFASPVAPSLPASYGGDRSRNTRYASFQPLQTTIFK